jgi:CheY-like chemotaxis protein
MLNLQYPIANFYFVPIMSTSSKLRKINSVLFVDDDKVTNFLNHNVISNLNIANKIIMKVNGKDAIDYLKEGCSSTDYPDLILLDIKMPVMDGFEFLRQFEELFNQINHTIHLVVLTTSKDSEDIARLRRLGDYHFENKPLTIQKFLDIHHRYFKD